MPSPLTCGGKNRAENSHDLFEATAVQLVLAIFKTQHYCRHFSQGDVMATNKRDARENNACKLSGQRRAMRPVVLIHCSHAATLCSGLVPHLMESSTFSHSNDFSSLICNEVSNWTWFMNSLDLHFYLHVMNISHRLRDFLV